MRSFRLDENANAGRLKEACDTEGKVRIQRFPKRMRNKGVKDPEILQWIAKGDAPLITKDALIKVNHERDLPETHPGIVVLASASPNPLTRRGVLRLLADFKGRVPNWDQLPLRNSILEIWDREQWNVCIAHAHAGKVHREERLRYDDPEWEKALRAALQRNAQDS